ncbi:hypothetical protein ACRAWD_27315 [Caulobacter segnis]
MVKIQAAAEARDGSNRVRLAPDLQHGLLRQFSAADGVEPF